jgi:hypothetical protein
MDVFQRGAGHRLALRGQIEQVVVECLRKIEAEEALSGE